MGIFVGLRFAVAVGLALGLAACGQGDSGNVMAPDVNTLSPAQIDAALGPETGNGVAPANEVIEAEPVPAQDTPPPAARPAPVPRESTPRETEPVEDSADETPPETNTTEQ